MKHKFIFYISITVIYFLIDVFIRNNPWYESVITVIAFLFMFMLAEKLFNSKEAKNTKNVQCHFGDLYLIRQSGAFI